MKATGRKDVKGVSNAKSETALDVRGNLELAINESAGIKDKATSPRKGKKFKNNEGGDQQKSRQSTVNLVGVDAKRFSDFCSYVYLFPSIAVQLTFSM